MTIKRHFGIHIAIHLQKYMQNINYKLVYVHKYIDYLQISLMTICRVFMQIEIHVWLNQLVQLNKGKICLKFQLVSTYK